MTKKAIFKFIYYLFLIAAFLFVVLTIYKFCFENIIEFDDFEFLYPQEDSNFFHKYIEIIYHGKILSNFVIILLNFDLPKLLSIHPITWSQTGGAVIKGIFYFITFYLLSSTLYLSRKKDIILPVALVAAYIFIVTNYLALIQMELYAAFYCFVFPFIFFILFWNLFIKKYLELKEDINYKLLIIYGFLTGLSAEITAITTTSALVILTVLNIINKQKNNNQLLYKSLIAVVIGNILYFTNPSFLILANGKGVFTNTIKQVLPLFLSGYKHLFTHEFLPYILVILTLGILILFMAKRNNTDKKLLTVVCSILIGCFVFHSSLILAGVRSPDYNYSFIVHLDILVQMYIMFIYIIFLELSGIKDNKSFYIILLILLSCCLFKIEKFHKVVTDFSDCGLVHNYTNEKILAYYSYKNLPIIAEKSARNRLYENTVYIRTLYNPNYSCDISQTVYTETLEEAIIEYEKNGGKHITEEEQHKHAFTKLLNKEFVLGTKSD